VAGRFKRIATNGDRLVAIRPPEPSNPQVVPPLYQAIDARRCVDLLAKSAKRKVSPTLTNLRDAVGGKSAIGMQEKQNVAGRCGDACVLLNRATRGGRKDGSA